MYIIEFVKQTEVNPLAAESACFVCKSAKSSPVLNVSTSLIQDLHMVECSSCGTKYFVGEDTVLGYDHTGFEEDYWLNYVQNGAGITSMLQPLLEVARKDATLLDVGCGFGFVPHYWQTMGYGESVGLETSMYGRKGREKLGINIIHDYYNDAAEIKGRKFDFVFSSEVIEHVPNPLAFLNEIKQALADDGILVMTTPSAAGINPQTRRTDLVAILSPGFHFFLTTANSFEKLLKDAGFKHVRVIDSGSRLFAWASNKPLPKTDLKFKKWEDYLAYLKILTQSPDPHIKGGAAYRLLKDSLNRRKYEYSTEAGRTLRDVALQTYGIELDNPLATARDSLARTGLQNDKFPSWLGTGMLFYGILKSKAKPKLISSFAPYFEGAKTIMDYEIVAGEQFAQEAAHFLPKAEKYLSKSRQARLKELEDSTPLEDAKFNSVRESETSSTGDENLLLMGFAPNGVPSPACIALGRAFSERGIKVHLCLSVNSVENGCDQTEVAFASSIHLRENAGMDFGMWAHVLKRHPELWSSNILYFANDSIIGPMNGFENTIARIRGSSADLVSLTANYSPVFHTQSYLFALKNQSLVNADVRSFWAEIRNLKSKWGVVRAYEIGFTEIFMRSKSLKTDILFPLREALNQTATGTDLAKNPTHDYWRELIKLGFPFIKGLLLYSNPRKTELSDWENVLQVNGGSIKVAQDHLAFLESTRGKRKISILKRILGPSLYQSLRDWNRTRLESRKNRIRLL